MRDTTVLEEGVQKIFPAVKVPEQCSLVLLVVVSLREGKALGSEDSKGIEQTCPTRRP
jgi:hypothetical protein